MQNNKEGGVSDFYIRRHVVSPDLYLRLRPVTTKRILSEHPYEASLLVIEHVVMTDFSSADDYEAVAIRESEHTEFDFLSLIENNSSFVVPANEIAWDALLELVDSIDSTPSDLDRWNNSASGRSSLLFISYWDGSVWRNTVRRYPGDYLVTWRDAPNLKGLDNELIEDMGRAIRRSIRQRHVADMVMLLRSFHAIRVKIPKLIELFENDIAGSNSSVFD